MTEEDGLDEDKEISLHSFSAYKNLQPPLAPKAPLKKSLYLTDNFSLNSALNCDGQARTGIRC